ncbi:MAG: hypothetical protein IT260_09080, partial [Saprospiraceae bacterium]|nr:hypothetical protein [Saprospiraceae bacterium]
WLIGNDFLYDRYGATPYNFEETDFAYQYLGIASYDLQSYGDDGNVGLPVAQPDAATAIGNLDDLYWKFGTIWWADGVTPLPGAETVYHMGDSTYLFDGVPCAVLNKNNGMTVLTYFFDLSFASSFESMRDNVEAVIDYVQVTTGVNEHPNRDWALQVRPNPFRSQLQFQWQEAQPTTLQHIRLLDMQGKTVATVQANAGLGTGDTFRWNLPVDLPAGLYHWQALSTEGMLSGKVLRQ